MSGLMYGNKYTLTGSGDNLRAGGKPAPRKTIYVFDEEENLLGEYKKVEDAVEKEELSLSALRTYIKHRILANRKYYSYDKVLKPQSNIF